MNENNQGLVMNKLRPCKFIYKEKRRAGYRTEWDTCKATGYFHEFKQIDNDVMAICEDAKGNVKIVWEIETIQFTDRT